MSFRTVFMAVGATQDDAEVDRAVAICEELGAHLSLLVLGIAPPPPASPYGVVSNDIWAGDIRQGQDEAAERAQALEAKLAGTTISSLVTAQYIDRGSVATLAARHARYADLTLVTPGKHGRGHEDADEGELVHVRRRPTPRRDATQHDRDQQQCAAEVGRGARDALRARRPSGGGLVGRPRDSRGARATCGRPAAGARDTHRRVGARGAQARGRGPGGSRPGARCDRHARVLVGLRTAAGVGSGAPPTTLRVVSEPREIHRVGDERDGEGRRRGPDDTSMTRVHAFSPSVTSCERPRSLVRTGVRVCACA